VENKPRFHGTLYKQGSGKGFFSNTKWKEKLLILMTGTIYYFDKTDVSTTNKASRVISLHGCRVENFAFASEASAPFSFGIKLITAERNFVFCCQNENDRNKWEEAIVEEAKVAMTMKSMQRRLGRNSDSSTITSVLSTPVGLVADGISGISSGVASLFSSSSSKTEVPPIPPSHSPPTPGPSPSFQG